MRSGPVSFLQGWLSLRRVAIVVAVLCVTACLVPGLRPDTQKLTKLQHETALVMAKNTWEDLRKNYYDPNLKGVDMEARFREASQKIEQAQSFGQVFVAIQWALDGLHDSHTNFIPPARPNRTEYGWRMEMYGNHCYVSAVKPGSDAEKRGMQAGDQVLTIDGYMTTRETVPELERLFEALLPQTTLNVQGQTLAGKRDTLDVESQTQKLATISNVFGEEMIDPFKAEHGWYLMNRSKWWTFKDQLMIWKMPEFYLFRDPSDIDRIMNEANKRKTLILDLRGNPGGATETLDKVAGSFFDHDLELGEARGRKERNILHVKTRGGKAFTGKLIVLVDSDTASAAEILTRAVQLEKRGTVIGDRTAGMVMAARLFGHKSSADNYQNLYYGTSVSVYDVVMKDGKRIEGVGVTPDEVMLPTPQDLAAGLDPVMAHAMGLAGITYPPEKAAKLFPVLWEEDAKQSDSDQYRELER